MGGQFSGTNPDILPATGSQQSASQPPLIITTLHIYTQSFQNNWWLVILKRKFYYGLHGWRITVSNILEMTFCVRIEIKVNYKIHKLSINWFFLRWGINLDPARHHGRRNHSWGRGDSDQLWLRINLCSALIGSPPELAFTDRSYWPALSTDLYHRSGTHFVANSQGKHEEMRIFNRKKCTDHVLETKRLRTTFLCS